MTRTTFLRLASVLFLLATYIGADAQKKDDFDPFNAPIEDNIRHPKVQPKQSANVAAEMKNLQKALTSAGFSPTTVRSGEVVVVTLPCSELFAANSTVLSPKGKSRLTPLLPYVRRSDRYKVVIAVHSDNTGDDKYADNITAERANALDDFLSENKDSAIIPYGLGSDEPVAANNSVSQRAKNRRVEIYFIPTETTIQKAKKR